MAGTELTTALCSNYKASHALTWGWTFWQEEGMKLRERTKKKRGRRCQDRECSCSSVSPVSLWIPREKRAVPRQNNLNCPGGKRSRSLLFALPGWQVQRGSSSSMLSFTPPPPSACLAELACEWFLAETAAWTDSRWAKEEARLSFIQTLLWIAAGGWCIQIPQTLTGLFSWWRPWGWGDGEKNQRCCFITNPEDNNVHKQRQ